MDGKRKAGYRDIGDRIEILHRIVERPGLENCLGDMRARAAEQKHVTVGPGVCDCRRAERAPAAPLVLDHDRPEQRLDPLRPGAPDGVVSTARRKRNDEPDRTLRIAALRKRRARRAGTNRDGSQPQGEQVTSSHRALLQPSRLPARHKLRDACSRGPAHQPKQNALIVLGSPCENILRAQRI